MSTAYNTLRARANALRTATSANFTARRNALRQAMDAAANRMGTLLGSGRTLTSSQTTEVNRLGELMQRATRTYRHQARPGSGASSGGRSSAGASSGEGEGLVSRFVKTIGGAGWGGSGGGETTSRRRSTTPTQRRRPAASEPDFDDDPDFGPPTPVGLFAAIGRTVSGDFGPGGVLALWNPPVGLLSRPSFRLFALSTALAFTGAGVLYVASKKKARPKAQAPSRLEGARAELAR